MPAKKNKNSRIDVPQDWQKDLKTTPNGARTVVTPPHLPLADQKHEMCAQMLVRGYSKKAIERHCDVAHTSVMRWTDVNTPVGKIVMRRVHWLQKQAADKFVLNLQMLYSDLYGNALKAAEQGQFKASNEALMYLAEEAKRMNATAVDTVGEAVATLGDGALMKALGGAHGEVRSEEAADEPDPTEGGEGVGEGVDDWGEEVLSDQLDDGEP